MVETTPILGTNPQITKIVLVQVERDELEIEPLSMVAMVVGGRSSTTEVQRAEEWVCCF